MSERIDNEIMDKLAELLPEVANLDESAPAIEPRKRPKEPWHANYNPVTDATPVVRFGATWIRPGRYMDPSGLLMDENGALVDANECPGCGSTPGHDVSRFVKIRPESPFAPAWQYDWTYCRVCTPMQKRGELPERRPGPRR